MASKEKAKKEASNETGAGLPLFYKAPNPLDAKAHADFGLKDEIGLGFTRGINAVPVNMIEMPQICHNYPIAFSPDENATPVAILGLRDGENLFLNDDDTWLTSRYIPAYIRRYPFIFSEMAGSDQLTLCVDMIEGETVVKGGGNAFFDAEGKPSDLSNNALEFCKSYHAAAQRTLEFSKALVAHDLLMDRQAQINVGDSVRINFSGFKIIDEKKLAALDDAVFMEWRAKGWLPFVYAHLFSGAQWRSLSGLLAKRLEETKD